MPFTRIPFLFALLVVGCVGAPAIGWAQQQGGLMLATIFSAPPPQDNSMLSPVYSGVAVSTDRGATWKSTAYVTNRSNGLCQDAADPAVLYLASDYGVLRSDDHGQNWSLVTPWYITDAFCVAAQSDAVWIGTARGVYCTTDRGVTWVERNGGLPALNGRYIADLIIHGDTLCIATADGLFASGDRGLSWFRCGLQGLAVDKLYRRGQTMYALSSSNGLRTSRDGGATWEEHPSALKSKSVQTLAIHPQRPNELLIGTRDIGVLQSVDAGERWVNRSGGLTNLNVTALAYDPSDVMRMYLGTENGSYVSHNGGESWEPFTIRMGQISSFIIPVQP